MEEAIKWFLGSDKDRQLEILRCLVYIISQSGAIGKDGEEAIRQSQLKPTYTPCQLLLKVVEKEPKGNLMLRSTLSKIIHLPALEREKSFRLLAALFHIADSRKRELGLQPDKYWWHQDLSDKEIVEKILSIG